MRCIVQQAGSRRAHLKTLGTQMGHPVRVLVGWLSKLMTRLFFGRFCQVGDVNLLYQTNPRAN